MEQEEDNPSILHFFVIEVLSLEGVMSTTRLCEYTQNTSHR